MTSDDILITPLRDLRPDEWDRIRYALKGPKGKELVDRILHLHDNPIDDGVRKSHTKVIE